MTSLETIIAVGVARYEALYAPPLADVAELETTPNLTGVDEERQRQLCLSCPLADCVGVESSACPIRIEQRRVWRERGRP